MIGDDESFMLRARTSVGHRKIFGIAQACSHVYVIITDRACSSPFLPQLPLRRYRGSASPSFPFTPPSFPIPRASNVVATEGRVWH